VMGTSVFENGNLVKSIIGDSDDSMELAQNFMSGAMNFGDDLVDFV